MTTRSFFIDLIVRNHYLNNMKKIFNYIYVYTNSEIVELKFELYKIEDKVL